MATLRQRLLEIWPDAESIRFEGRCHCRATICINGKNKVLGFFPEAEEAYKAYCEAALKYHGEFANLG